ncbi:MAG: Sugar kinase, ribokinase family [Parcubacteria group bacterium Gr01-1014_48]|nr:MAG: Sugar kinase, ribokinase family [Parcubacteria group bacterium Greene0416_14]TSC74068.1 MAG: Sugar kinase, ribokinase family [Parcubacteria group bacterium Gr01-1014_48]TSD01144.1 MAG: Sugar kinase, ribokinase family [Parcubacteria group bacterium Greene1014_15]TSD08220.1 MAG: Sugar kinase, ribokinase family [Parcubacteria group bacterium Greene0714_4]
MADSNIDFVAIGDITTDAFIRLKQSEAHVVETDGRKEICMSFGDKIPYEKVDIVRAVGNSPNAAVGAARLGLTSAVVTIVGDDENGRECVASLQASNVRTDFITVQKNIETNYHYVLSYGAERTILVKHHEYDYQLPDIGEPTWVYVSSLAENSLPFHHKIAAYLAEHPNIKLAFQPGTFQIKLGYDKLKDIYARSELFFCNKEEAERILNRPPEKIETLLEGIRNLGPKIAIITDGPKGAYTHDGNEIWYMPMYPDPAPPTNRTGAGDAFSSTFTSALILGKTIPEALAWGPINSMSVVQYVGAQRGLLARETLEAFLESAPSDYVAKRM